MSACLRHLGRLAPGIMKRPLPINVSGAIPALMLDVGWPLEAIKGIPLLARTAGLVAHLYEESLRPIGFIMSNHADLAIAYDGPPAAAAKPGEAPMVKILADLRVVEMGTYITGPAAGMHLADLGADVIKVERPGGRPVPRLQGRALLAALPDLQPQQALDRARHRRAPPTAPSSTSWSRPPTCSSRTSAPASPSSSAPGRGAAAAQPAPRLLRHLRLRHDGPLARPPGLRHGRAGGERLTCGC